VAYAVEMHTAGKVLFTSSCFILALKNLIWKMFYDNSSVTCEWVILWLSVLNVEMKYLVPERLGRWLVDPIKVEREQSLL